MKTRLYYAFLILIATIAFAAYAYGSLTGLRQLGFNEKQSELIFTSFSFICFGLLTIEYGKQKGQCLSTVGLSLIIGSIGLLIATPFF